MKNFPLILYFCSSLVLSAQVPEWVLDFYDEPWISERGMENLSGWYPRTVGTQAEKLWSLALDENFSAPPVMRDGRLYCAGESGVVYCYSITGNLLWKMPTADSFDASPLALSDRIIVGALSGRIYALEKWSGTILWTFDAEGRLTAGANVMKVGNKQLVIAGTYSGFLYALDSQSGELAWRTKAESFINGSAAIVGNTAAFGSCDGKLRIVDSQGNIIWFLSTESYIPESSAITGEAIYMASYAGLLYKADITTGEILWQAKAAEEAAFFTSPAVCSQYVVCAAKDDVLYVYRTDSGKLATTFELDGTLSGSPIIAGTSIIWMTAGGNIVVADPKKPLEKPLLTLTGSKPAGGFMISQKKIYFCTTNGQIHCWRMK